MTWWQGFALVVIVGGIWLGAMCALRLVDRKVHQSRAQRSLPPIAEDPNSSGAAPPARRDSSTVPANGGTGEANT